MFRCTRCNKLIILKEKRYIYPGKEKGSFEITEEQIVCQNCLEMHQGSDKSLEGGTNVVLLIAKKEFEKALTELNSIFDEKNQGNWYSKGNILWNLNNPEEAIRCYNEALFLDTHYKKAWYRKGILLGDKELYIDAAKCFENVVELDGRDKKEGRKLSGWGLPALVSCMGAWTKANNELVYTGHPSAEAYKNSGKWIEWGHRFLTTPQPIYEESTGNLKYVTLVSPGLNETEFIDYCLNNFNKILDAIEPRIVTQFYVSGERH
jgi:tetratricopeptide (TPR) repeat protein